MNTNTEVFRNNRMATGTSLRSTVRVDCNELSASFFRFAREHAEELPPTGIGNRLGKAMIADHPLDIQLFNGDDAEMINELSGFLVDEVMSAVGNALVNTAYYLSGLSSLRCALLKFAQLPLGFRQCLFVHPEEAEIGNLLPGRHGSERCQPDINTHSFIRCRQWFRLVLNRKRSVPLVTLAPDGACTDFSKDWTMDFNSDITHFSEFKTAVNSEAELSVGEAIIAVKALEARISRILTSLDPTKESSKAFVQPVSHVLEYLGVDSAESGTFRLKFRDTLALLEIRKAFLLLFPSSLAFLKELIIEPATFIKLGLKQCGLMLGGEQSIFKSFLHYVVLYLKYARISIRGGRLIHPQL